jgi:hypothetical protein
MSKNVVVWLAPNEIFTFWFALKLCALIGSFIYIPVILNTYFHSKRHDCAGLKKYLRVSTICFSGNSYVGDMIWGKSILIYEFVRIMPRFLYKMTKFIQISQRMCPTVKTIEVYIDKLSPLETVAELS